MWRWPPFAAAFTACSQLGAEHSSKRSSVSIGAPCPHAVVKTLGRTNSSSNRSIVQATCRRDAPGKHSRQTNCVVTRIDSTEVERIARGSLPCCSRRAATTAPRCRECCRSTENLTLIGDSPYPSSQIYDYPSALLWYFVHGVSRKKESLGYRPIRAPSAFRDIICPHAACSSSPKIVPVLYTLDCSISQLHTKSFAHHQLPI